MKSLFFWRKPETLLINVKKIAFGNKEHITDKKLEVSVLLRLSETLAWPAVVQYWFSFTLTYSRISHEYSSLFIIVINLIFMFSL